MSHWQLVSVCPLCSSTTKSLSKEMQICVLSGGCAKSRWLINQMAKLLPTLNFSSLLSLCMHILIFVWSATWILIKLISKCLSLESLPPLQNKETSELFKWKTEIKIHFSLYFFSKQSYKWALNLSQNLLRELLLILCKYRLIPTPGFFLAGISFCVCVEIITVGRKSQYSPYHVLELKYPECWCFHFVPLHAPPFFFCSAF